MRTLSLCTLLWVWRRMIFKLWHLVLLVLVTKNLPLPCRNMCLLWDAMLAKIGDSGLILLLLSHMYRVFDYVTLVPTTTPFVYTYVHPCKGTVITSVKSGPLSVHSMPNYELALNQYFQRASLANAEYAQDELLYWFMILLRLSNLMASWKRIKTFIAFFSIHALFC